MSQTRVIYKPDPNSTDEFILFAMAGQVEKWRKDKYEIIADIKVKKRDLRIMLICLAFHVFHSGQGAQGKLGAASKQTLENVFNTSKDVDVAEKILTDGRIEESKKAGEKWSTKNDSQGDRSSHGH